MTFPSKFIPKNREFDDPGVRPGVRVDAPSPHMDALLRALEATDEALTPLTRHGMNGRTATILREIEKSGAISLRTDEDDLWIDVIDRKKALIVIDKLMETLKQ